MGIDSYTDQEIVKAILRRDTEITKEFLYRKCYPLFAAIHSKYYTGCETPIELINEIYVYILLPQRETHRSKLQDFGFRCTFTLWLKIVTENYCRQLFEKRIRSEENVDVESDNEIKTIWYECNKEFQEYLCIEKIDGKWIFKDTEFAEDIRKLKDTNLEFAIFYKRFNKFNAFADDKGEKFARQYAHPCSDSTYRKGICKQLIFGYEFQLRGFSHGYD